jgi:hypothetical protein
MAHALGIQGDRWVDFFSLDGRERNDSQQSR